MTISAYPHNLLLGLSDFWQRFFADADKLEALYKGSSFLLGQAYLDLLYNVLSPVLSDCPLTVKEYWKLFTVREDEISYKRGATPSLDRYVFNLDTAILNIESLDNRVLEPTQSLFPSVDFELDTKKILFKVDPTDVNGVPLSGFARRQVEILAGGKFTDIAILNWRTGTDVKKGDIVRLLLISPGGAQKRVTDHSIIAVRTDGLVFDADTPMSPGIPINYTILRKNADEQVLLEDMVFIGLAATLVHTRLEHGSVLVYATVGGVNVIEGVDYTVDYEGGIIRKLTAWDVSSINKVDYRWWAEVYPLVGVPPKASTTGVCSAHTTERVTELAMWGVDTEIDRRILALNFATLIGVDEQASTESYRAFLRGIFQLYLLGPVLERVESALNLVLGLPVIRNDGEILDGFEGFDNNHPNDNYVFTLRNGVRVTYAFPKDTPLRADIQLAANIGVLTFHAFEPLTTAITVTDYIKTPSWWHSILIPEALFSDTVPEGARRIVSNRLIPHVVNPEDEAKVGDPGVFAGADDEGFTPPEISPGVPHPIFRHRVAYVLMDKYFKFHMFAVTFDTGLFTTTGTRYVRTINELRNLIIDSRPAHTFAYFAPHTHFVDTIIIDDSVLGLTVQLTGEDFKYVDTVLTVGVNGWQAGDYFRYEVNTDTPVAEGAFPYTVLNAPIAPRRRRLVSVELTATIGGVRVVEGLDYTVDYETAIITKLPSGAWDGGTTDVTYIQLNIGNVVDDPPAYASGDTEIIVAGLDPALVRYPYGTTPDLAEDFSIVERTLTVAQV